MVDIAGLITALAPYVLQLITAVFSFVGYLKTNQVYAAVVQKTAPASLQPEKEQ